VVRRGLAAVAALAMLGGCGGNGKKGGGDVVTFQDTRGSSATATSPPTATAPAKTTPHARTSPATPTGGSPSSAGAGGGRGPANQLFTITVPGGWTRKDSTLAGGLRRSEWRDPSNPGISVLVDAVPGASSTPKGRAARNRDRGATKAGYREDDFSSISLGGRPGFVWEYEVGNRRIVDYFLNDCGVGYAIQGTASTMLFSGAARAFHEAAASLRSTHC
jgi:hypothetical protein